TTKPRFIMLAGKRKIPGIVRVEKKKNPTSLMSVTNDKKLNARRIVSFLPAATEMVYVLGLGDQLVGVSHECDFPAAARMKPVVIRPALAFEEMSLREIDVAVSERMRNGQSIYQVDENLLRELRPNL